MKASLALAILLAAAAFGAAATDLIQLEWSAEGEFAKEMRAPAGKFVEACGRLPAGTQVAWSFEAGAPTDFNIHFHEGKKVSFPAKKSAVSKASGTLDAKVEQDYCWMWTNKGSSDANLRFKLARRQSVGAAGRAAPNASAMNDSMRSGARRLDALGSAAKGSV